MTIRKGFTLIEVLVVVLIIAVLAAVALPQYNKAVEKARMTEAITLVRAIANANQVFYMANGRYAASTELSLLDITIPGLPSGPSKTRIDTQYFQYSPTGTDGKSLALAKRLPEFYHIYITQDQPDHIHCLWFGTASQIQRKLCDQLDENGIL